MSEATVLVSDKLSQVGLDYLVQQDGITLRHTPGLKAEALLEAVQDVDALIIRSGTQVTAEVIAAAPRLKVIGRAGIGVDNVDVAAASRRGIVVMNTPTGNAVTTAEHALALLFSLARFIPQATASTKAGRWEKSRFQGRELTGKTLGIVGLGNIGRIVAARAQGLKMRVIASDPVLSADKATRLGVELVSFDELLRRADCITIHAPLNDHTRGLFDDDAFAQTKPGLLLVHAARGGIVDEAALARALDKGQLAGAALDVFVEEPVSADHPLLASDRIICTPHLGASTAEAQDRVAGEIALQVCDFLQTGQVQNAVNAPSVQGDAATALQPYLQLSERLGLLLAQLEALTVQELEVRCSGRPGELGVHHIALATLSGFLARHLNEAINPVRAPYEAEARGLKVVEVRDDQSGGHADTVQVTLRGREGSHTATGCLGPHGEARLLTLEGLTLDAFLAGAILVIRNSDKPGVIGALGTELGQVQINVSRMQVGLNKETGEAISLWNIDSAVPPTLLGRLRQLDNVHSVRCITL
ncbi:MAG: phosphoglycerate dehydrogenase [Polyangiales bacterium]